MIWASPRRKNNNYFLIFLIILINLTWIDISVHSRAHCRGRLVPRRIHAHSARRRNRRPIHNYPAHDYAHSTKNFISAWATLTSLHFGWKRHRRFCQQQCSMNACFASMCFDTQTLVNFKKLVMRSFTIGPGLFIVCCGVRSLTLRCGSV